jgi:hypothetical protein
MRKIASAAEMPFLEHLEERRRRIIRAPAAISIAILLAPLLLLRGRTWAAAPHA